jgi:large subunit ribosomal protein L10
MAKTKQQKIDISEKLADKLQKATSVVFTDYKGLKMSQLKELRSQLAENSAEFTITKNTLLEAAFRREKIEVSDAKATEGPTATLFSYGDEVSAIKILTKALKTFEVGSVKGGLIDGEFMAADKVKRLAELPSKDELRAKVVGSLGAPLYGIVGVLQGNLRNLVYALDQIRISKGGE